jgi:5-(hydroxymethyl)furfural/furfural oxidase
VPWHRNVRGRVSSNDAYLDPARDRPNLEVRGLTQVDCIRVSGRRAVGVWLEAAGDRRFVEAGEVILAAGAIHSPPILLRSGIGPADALRAVGVKLVADLPGVGFNLHDHPIVVLPIELAAERRPPTARVPIDGCLLRWQIAAPADALICPLDILRADTRYGGLMVALLQPLSRGRLTLSSPSLHQQPRVELWMLSEASDRERLRTAVRHALHALDHPSLRAVGDSRSQIRDLQDDELDAWLEASCNAFSHAAGSCRIGSPDDPLAVVDADCRVIGVEGLRVADSSIMPALPRAAPHLAVTMIAEHLARRLP